MALMPPTLRSQVAVPELEQDVLEALRAEPVAALGGMAGRPGADSRYPGDAWPRV